MSLEHVLYPEVNGFLRHVIEDNVLKYQYSFMGEELLPDMMLSLLGDENYRVEASGEFELSNGKIEEIGRRLDGTSFFEEGGSNKGPINPGSWAEVHNLGEPFSEEFKGVSEILRVKYKDRESESRYIQSDRATRLDKERLIASYHQRDVSHVDDYDKDRMPCGLFEKRTIWEIYKLVLENEPPEFLITQV